MTGKYFLGSLTLPRLDDLTQDWAVMSDKQGLIGVIQSDEKGVCVFRQSTAIALGLEDLEALVDLVASKNIEQAGSRFGKFTEPRRTQ